MIYIYILVGGSEHPYDYYSGGTHISDGERIPNTVHSVDFAKKYDNELKAIKQAERLNSKYSWWQTFTVYKIGDQIYVAHGTMTLQ